MEVQKGKRCLHSGQTFAKSFVKMTVWVLAKRSSRIYEKNVQYNDRTDKKLESLFPHSRHLLPPTDRGEEESLTAIVQNSVSLCFSIPEPAKDVNLRGLTSCKSVL